MRGSRRPAQETSWSARTRPRRLHAPTAADEPSGPPAVIYFEKQQVEGRPTFVGVPPREGAARTVQAAPPAAGDGAR